MARTRRFSQQEAYRLARRAGATDAEARFLAAVMIPESGGDPNAVNRTSGATGLWQIHPGGAQYKDPLKNAQTAIYKLRTQGREAWEAYTRGLVRAYNPGGLEPAGAGGRPDSTGASPPASQRSAFARALLNPRTVHDPLKLLGAIKKVQAAPDAVNPAEGGPKLSQNGSTLSQLEPLALQFGLKVTSTTGGKHVPGSWHYQGRAVDYSGDQARMMSLMQYALAHPGQFKEAFYDPAGVYIKNGKVYRGSIGGHSDHVHLAR